MFYCLSFCVKYVNCTYMCHHCQPKLGMNPQNIQCSNICSIPGDLAVLYNLHTNKNFILQFLIEIKGKKLHNFGIYCLVFCINKIGLSFYFASLHIWCWWAVHFMTVLSMRHFSSWLEMKRKKNTNPNRNPKCSRENQRKISIKMKIPLNYS